LLACGPAPAIDVGTDFLPDEVPSISPDASPDDLIPGPSESLVSADISPACRGGFQPCGGLLAGMWIVEETCNSETRNRKALQIWGQTFMRLDSGACLDAVQSVKSRWEGELSFRNGVAIDTRLRHDMIEMNLSRTCLNATYGVNIQAERIPSVCATLTRDQTSCTAVSGSCHCSSRREAEISHSGTYGVLGTSVAIGTTPGLMPDYFDYCVTGDTLLWREPGSARFVVLHRQSAAEPVDPPYEVR
jgi:hypothetical protein